MKAVVGNLSIMVTLLIAYQIYYNTLCIMEMGGIYLSKRKFLTTVAVLLPGLKLGVHTSKAWFVPATPWQKKYDYIALFYMGLGVAELVFFVATYMKWAYNQNAPQD